MTEVCMTGKCSEFFKPFVTDSIKETEKTASIVAHTSLQTRCGKPGMIKEAPFLWCRLQQNLIAPTPPAPPPLCVYSSLSPCEAGAWTPATLKCTQSSAQHCLRVSKLSLHSSRLKGSFNSGYNEALIAGYGIHSFCPASPQSLFCILSMSFSFLHWNMHVM